MTFRKDLHKLILKMRFKLHLSFIFILFSFLSFAQGEKKIVQVSGLVVSSDSSAYGIIGAYIYVQKSGRGTISNRYGYFSFPALAGDEIIVSHLGYKQQRLLVPNDTSNSVSLLIQLVQDTTVLPIIEVTYFPTEKEFKKAILDADVSHNNTARKNLNGQILERLFVNSDMSASENFTYYMNRQIIANEQKYLAPYNPLMDPFAWGRAIKDIVKAVKKKKKK